MNTFSALEIPKVFLIAGAHLRVSISSVWDEVTKVFIILYVQYTYLFGATLTRFARNRSYT